MRNYGCLAILSLALALAGCGENRSGNTVAKVEKRALKLNELTYPADAQTAEAIENWINNEVLLYHSGRQKGVNFPYTQAGDLFSQRLRARAFLDSLVRSRIQLSDSSVAEYYRQHPDEFAATGRSAHIIHIGFFKEKEAVAARAALAGVTSATDSLWLGYNRDEKLVVEGRLHPELGQRIFSAALHRITGPVASEFGFHLLFVVRRFDSGDQLPFEMVQKKVIHRMLLQAWPAMEAAVLDSLREEIDVEIFSE